MLEILAKKFHTYGFGLFSRMIDKVLYLLYFSKTDWYVSHMLLI